MSSGKSNLFSTSALNLPTDSDKSKERGSISPDQEGTVGFLPRPSFTTTVDRFDSINWYVLPPRTKISFFDKNRSGELTSIIVNDVSNMRIALGTSFHKVFIEPINILTFVFILFVINIKLATIALFIIPVTSFIILLIGRSIRRKSKRTAEQIAGIMGRITEILNSIRVVKAFANEDYEKDRFKKQQDKYYSLITRRAKLKLTAYPITETI